MVATIKKILKARIPEDLFGKNLTAETLKAQYKKMAKEVHPDRFRSKPKEYPHAQEAFIRLSQLRDEAETFLEKGYSAQKESFSVNIAGNFYYIKEKLYSGSISDIHRCTFGTKDYLAKIAKNSSYNDFIQNEATTLNELKLVALHDYDCFDLFSRSIASFTLLGELQKEAVVIRWEKGFVSLETILKNNPRGIGIANTLNILGRMYRSLEFIHQNKIAHGSLVPSHFIVDPEKDYGKLIDWSASYDSYRDHRQRRAIKEEYLNYYPYDRQASASADIYMASKIGLSLVGGDVRTNEAPDTVPRYLYDFLMWGTQNSMKRPNSIRELMPEFRWVCSQLRHHVPTTFRT